MMKPPVDAMHAGAAESCSYNPGASRHRESDEGAGLFLGIALSTSLQLLKSWSRGWCWHERLQRHDAEPYAHPG